MVIPPTTVTVQVLVQVQSPSHIAVTVVLVLAVDIQPASRTPVEDSVQMPRLEAIVELVVSIAIVREFSVFSTDPPGIGPSETRRSASVWPTAVKLGGPASRSVAVPPDGMEAEWLV
jgi:hypothetical protein